MGITLGLIDGIFGAFDALGMGTGGLGLQSAAVNRTSRSITRSVVTRRLVVGTLVGSRTLKSAIITPVPNGIMPCSRPRSAVRTRPSAQHVGHLPCMLGGRGVRRSLIVCPFWAGEGELGRGFGDRTALG